MEQVLIKEEKYAGQYVAIKNIEDSAIIANGPDPKEVYDKAQEKGCRQPLILYIPSRDAIQIYFRKG